MATKTKTNKKVDKSKSPKLPKFYGKNKVEADIKAQGGKATELQKAMLAMNEMRNIYSKLLRKGISDTLNGTDNISDEDARTIVAMVRTMNKKLAPILDK